MVVTDSLYVTKLEAESLDLDKAAILEAMMNRKKVSHLNGSLFIISFFKSKS